MSAHETEPGAKPAEPASVAEAKPAVNPDAATTGAAPLEAAANPGATETLGAPASGSGSEVKPAPITEGTLGAAPITEANPEAAKAPEPVAAANLVSDAAKAPDIDDLIADANKLLQQLQKIKTDKNATAPNSAEIPNSAVAAPVVSEPEATTNSAKSEPNSAETPNSAKSEPEAITNSAKAEPNSVAAAAPEAIANSAKEPEPAVAAPVVAAAAGETKHIGGTKNNKTKSKGKNKRKTAKHQRSG